jgi:flagellar motor switch protein FliM
MPKIGLIALAETYLLGQGELDRFRPLVRRFFDHFREEIRTSTSAALRIRAIRDRVEACHVAAAERAFAAAFTKSPRFVAIASGHGSAIASSLEKIRPMLAMSAQCMLGPVTDELALAVPPAIFATSHVSAAANRPHPARGASDKERARVRFGNTRVEIRAVLGRREMTFSEVRALRPGAVVVLGPLNGAAPHVSLCCGDQILFEASAVAHRGWNRVLVQQTRIQGG